MKHRSARLVSLMAIVGLALTACGGVREVDDRPGSTADTGDKNAILTPGVFRQDDGGQPVEGGTITLADFTEARSTDPTQLFASGFAGGTVLVALYDQLIRYVPETGKFEPRLAESVEPNAEYTQWTVTLRPGVTFSDGTPINADAVVGSVDYYVEQRGPDMGIVGPHWKGIRKVDDMTVVFELTSGMASFRDILGRGMGMIVAPAAISGGEFKPVGAGAFTLESYKPQEEMRLSVNPNFWDGKPHIDTLRLVWLGDDQTKLEAFEGEAADMMVVRKPDMIAALREQEVPGAISVANLGNVVFANHVDGKPGADHRIREAFLLAVDPTTIVERLHDGYGLPGKQIFTPASQWHNTDLRIETDPEQARQLVEEAKADGWDGKIVYTSIAGGPSQEQALIIKAQLESVGFSVETEHPRTVADNTSRILIERNYQFGAIGQGVSDDNPYLSFSQHFHSESSSNATGYANPEMDKLIEELALLEGDERRPVIQQIGELYRKDAVGIPLGGNPAFAAWRDNTYGVVQVNEQMLDFSKAWKAN